MLHEFLITPFADAARQRHYAAVREALRADDTGPITLLLGNLAVEEDGPALDAVVVRPHSITVLLLVPRGGQLNIPALRYGTWKLDNTPLPGDWDTDNPFEQFQRQKEALASWLAPQLSSEQANLQFISGVVVFDGPVTFGPEVEEQLASSPATSGFQLLCEAGQLPRRLRQLARPDIDLTDADLTQWARDLAEDDAPAEPTPAASHSPAPESTSGSPLRRLWQWLGAHDVPDDAPYGYDAQAVAARRAEKQELEQVRHQLQADLNEQMRALEAREAEREQHITALRTQLAQAPNAPAEAAALQARLAAESREKTLVEEAIAASRAESAARNAELDAKIAQLSQLIQQLNTQPTPAAAATALATPGLATPTEATRPGSIAGAEAPRRATSVAATAALSFARLRQWRRLLPRLAMAAGALAVLGLGGWGLSRAVSASAPRPFQENGKWGFTTGGDEPVVPARYASVAEFREGHAVVEADGAFGLVNEEGEEVVKPAYDALNPYAGGYARVRVGDAYTFLDQDGQEFNTYYFNALDFAEGYAAVLDYRGWHYISGPREEDPAKPPVIFREAYSFQQGLARVRLADGYTFITPDYLKDPTEGTEPFGRYTAATDFIDGRARVTQQGRTFTIDTDGDEVK
ncbi:WG repeat-containing protein [Hymenobacter sp. J193]|uniref:WG repeat-containing protein n=1 Tax=Hymenobacter sp. J193 TaxID=2898429 RepID=UPI0021515279|nr:WG repeat-containing protein [Hymenobacter sp. J193]MCR5888982.1 WG repeat-containing protein [Hymenobacter sp. J193]